MRMSSYDRSFDGSDYAQTTTATFPIKLRWSRWGQAGKLGTNWTAHWTLSIVGVDRFHNYQVRLDLARRCCTLAGSLVHQDLLSSSSSSSNESHHEVHVESCSTERWSKIVSNDDNDDEEHSNGVHDKNITQKKGEKPNQAYNFRAVSLGYLFRWMMEYCQMKGWWWRSSSNWMHKKWMHHREFGVYLLALHNNDDNNSSCDATIYPQHACLLLQGVHCSCKQTWWSRSWQDISRRNTNNRHQVQR